MAVIACSMGANKWHDIWLAIITVGYEAFVSDRRRTQDRLTSSTRLMQTSWRKVLTPVMALEIMILRMMVSVLPSRHHHRLALLLASR